MARPINPDFSLFGRAARPRPRPPRFGLFDEAYGPSVGENVVSGILGFEQDPRSPRLIRPSDVVRALPVRAGPQAPMVKQNATARVRQAAPPSAPVGSDGLPPGVDWEFIGLREGDGKKASVPNNNGRAIGNSGVTVAHGLDLGAQDIRELEAYGLPPHLIAKFKPYLGVRRQDAIKLLEEMPLSITEAEQTLIDQKVRSRAYRETAANFDKSATGGATFEDLPEEAKTVLIDLWFQYPHPAKSIPKFWGHATSGRWRDAHRELKDFGDGYGPRRSREADHLNGAIQSGKLK